MNPEVKDEKQLETVVVVDVESDVDLRDKDEALRLVGLEKSNSFTEEEYTLVRRKLHHGFPSNWAGFLIWVFPTMYIAQQLRLAKYLGANIVAWGAIMMLHAIPSTFGPFFALRLLLGEAYLRLDEADSDSLIPQGMLESCVAPILILIVSMFYKKNEQGISFIPDRGFAPFKIIYLMLGALAIATGVAVLLWMPDSPANAPFLTKEERIAAIERIRDGQCGTENKRFKKEQVVEALLDIRTWLIVVATLLTNIPNGGLANFTNIIVKGFGYTTKQTLILSTPGGAIGIISAVVCGWYSDRAGERMLPIVWSLIPTLAGAAMLVALNGAAQKGALLFATWIVGTYGSSLAIIYAYNASNTSGHTKKVTVNALTLAAFCVANIVGTETFLPKDAPGYLPGKISILALLSAQLVLCFLIRWVNGWMNKKKRRQVEELKRTRGWMDDDVRREKERAAFADLTDKQ
ncbi:hypothetical protein BN946_scf185043.g119 [Trametes cinnabarina]|uniref:Major facilitator superfamily (MFS) profile domain-containing protein n=1 Tax=Pycnoporus cinnabarinus TaxID=5643 RepID=A0A060SPA8_PYCCI|nr:hypothetical protein BN946_scf185043.g119 [Trametes cinnabarina]